MAEPVYATRPWEELPTDAKQRLGNEICVRIATTLGARYPYDSQRFLERVLSLREQE